MIPRPDLISILRQFASGDLSGIRAARLLGDDVSPSDVFVWARDAGLLDKPPTEEDRYFAAQARRVLGLT